MATIATTTTEGYDVWPRAPWEEVNALKRLLRAAHCGSMRKAARARRRLGKSSLYEWIGYGDVLYTSYSRRQYLRFAGHPKDHPILRRLRLTPVGRKLNTSAAKANNSSSGALYMGVSFGFLTRFADGADVIDDAP